MDGERWGVRFESGLQKWGARVVQEWCVRVACKSEVREWCGKEVLEWSGSCVRQLGKRVGRESGVQEWEVQV